MITIDDEEMLITYLSFSANLTEKNKACSILRESLYQQLLTQLVAGNFAKIPWIALFKFQTEIEPYLFELSNDFSKIEDYHKYYIDLYNAYLDKIISNKIDETLREGK